jgi:hypothetical protein
MQRNCFLRSAALGLVCVGYGWLTASSSSRLPPHAFQAPPPAGVTPAAVSPESRSVAWASFQERDASKPAASLLAAAPGSPMPITGQALAAGNVNGDRFADLLLLTGTTLKVFFGSAQRVWQPEPDVTMELPAMGSEMVLADMDRDGKLDVVVADHESYAVNVLLGRGDGRFQPSNGSPFVAREGTQPHTHGVVVADVNGDGHLDIVTVNNDDGDMSLLLGDGKGTFARAPGSPFSCGPSPYPFAASDINGDGYADVLIPNSAPEAQTLTILLGNGRGELVPAPNSPFDCGTTVRYVASGDLNGDRLPDVVATHNDTPQKGRSLTILINKGQGRLAPTASSPLEVGHYHWGVEIADMDRDGNADLVVAADEAIRVFIGDGRGGFKPAAGSPYATGKGAWRLVVADFNGDGKLDVATRCIDADRLEVFFGN